MEQSRRKNYYRNISTGMVLKCVNMVTSFVNRTVFIYTLGAAYLGVSGLFTDILSIFSLAELGIGNAITFHLYKPLATDDKEEIKSLRNEDVENQNLDFLEALILDYEDKREEATEIYKNLIKSVLCEKKSYKAFFSTK